VPPREAVPAAANGRRGNGNGLTVGARLEYLIGPKLPNSIAHEIRKRSGSAGPTSGGVRRRT